MISKIKEELNKLVERNKITKKELKELLERINDPWEEVRGIFEHKKIPPVEYQKKIRKEWMR